MEGRITSPIDVQQLEASLAPGARLILSVERGARQFHPTEFTGKSTKYRVFASALLLAVASPVGAQYSINIRDVEVRALAADAARVMGKTFVVDSRVNQKVSVVTQRTLSRWNISKSYSRPCGPTGSSRSRSRVATESSSSKVPRPARPVWPARASGSEFVTEIVRLHNMDAPGAIETVRPLVSAQGSVTANKNANSLVIADFADNISRIRSLLRQMDSNDTSATKAQMVYLKNMGPREVAASLQGLVAGSSASVAVTAVDSATPSPSAATPPRSLGSPVSPRKWTPARPVERDPGLLARACRCRAVAPGASAARGQPITQPSSAPDFIRSQKGEGTGAGPWEVRLRRSSRLRPAPASSAGGRRIVTAIQEPTRSSSPPTRMRSDSSARCIRQLDTRREQVLVEAIIVEMADEAAKQLGVQFLLAGLEGSNIPFAVTNYSNASPNILTVAGAAAAEGWGCGTTTTTVNGQVVTTRPELARRRRPSGSGSQLRFWARPAVSPGWRIRSGNAIFGCDRQRCEVGQQESNILSTPSIMTLDNQEARILVGQEVPVTTGEALSQNFDNQFRTVERQNVGITLEVRPQINGPAGRSS